MRSKTPCCKEMIREKINSTNNSTKFIEEKHIFQIFNVCEFSDFPHRNSAKRAHWCPIHFWHKMPLAPQKIQLSNFSTKFEKFVSRVCMLYVLPWSMLRFWLFIENRFAWTFHAMQQRNTMFNSHDDGFKFLHRTYQNTQTNAHEKSFSSHTATNQRAYGVLCYDDWQSISSQTWIWASTTVYDSLCCFSFSP